MPDYEAALTGTLALIPQLVDAVHIPVIAAGGIMDGRGIVAALALGAAGAQLGTAFLAGPESAAPPAHKAALLSGEAETVVTRAFSGKPVRAGSQSHPSTLRGTGAGDPGRGSAERP